MNLSCFFYPKTICLSGASTKEKSIGYELLNTIISYKYQGDIFPVNPKADEILGLKCYHSIKEIDQVIDLAIVVVPKQFAEETIDEILAKGIKAIILITAGFRETGKEGAIAEERIVKKVHEAGARLIGPNCMGIINTLENIRLNATFVAEQPKAGSTGFLSQSGALGAAVLNSLRETDIRFAHFISVGNKADINENDILDYWNEQEDISTLTFYLESFVNGEAFTARFLEGTINKPVIILKAGKSSGGMKAASSHTGALGSSDKAADAVLEQFGIIRAENLNELFNTAKGFENFPLPAGNRIAVITNAGGPAILCVDALEKENLVLADIPEETKLKLRILVHPEGSVENPIDLLPGGTAQIYKAVNEILLADEGIDAVVSIFVEPVMVKPFEVVEAVASINSEKPLLQVVMPLPEFWNEYRTNSILKKPLFRNPEDPAEVISNMLFFSEKRRDLVISKNKRITGSLVSEQFNFLPGLLSTEQINILAEVYDLPVIKNLNLGSNELEKIPQEYFPAVLKAINKEIVHKSEFNAVALNISDLKQLIIEAENMKKNFESQNIRIDSFLIQPYIKVKHEILLGGFRDPSFGPMIMFGSGGKYVEVFNDTAIKSAYVSEKDIDDLIFRTKMGEILLGVRGETPADIIMLKSIIRNVAKMIVENKNIQEFDINPLVVSNDNRFYAVDMRVRIG